MLFFVVSVLLRWGKKLHGLFFRIPNMPIFVCLTLKAKCVHWELWTEVSNDSCPAIWEFQIELQILFKSWCCHLRIVAWSEHVATWWMPLIVQVQKASNLVDFNPCVTHLWASEISHSKKTERVPITDAKLASAHVLNVINITKAKPYEILFAWNYGL